MSIIWYHLFNKQFYDAMCDETHLHMRLARTFSLYNADAMYLMGGEL